MSKVKLLVWFVIFTAVSFLIYSTLYEKSYPLGALNLRYDAPDIEQKSTLLLNSLNIKTGELKNQISLNSNRTLMRQVQVEKGLEQGNELVRKGIPVYYWEVSWFKKDYSTVTITGSGSRRSKNSEASDEIITLYSSSGDLLEFSRHDLDSVELQKISLEEARMLGDDFLKRFTSLKNISTDSLQDFGGGDNAFKLQSAERRESTNKTDHQFTWSGKSEHLNNDLNITLFVSGDLVSAFKIEEIVPEEKYTSEVQPIFHAAAQILFYIVIFILIGILAFRRIRAFEIGFRTAIIMGLIVAILFGLELYFTISNQLGWEIILPLLIGPILFGAVVMLVWAVSETVTRETWEEKFISMDLLTKGYSLHSKIGSAFLTGSSTGFLISAIWILMFYLASLLLPVSFALDENQFLPYLNSATPAFTLIIHNIYSVIFVSAVFFLFLTSSLKRRLNSTVILILVASFLWGSVNMNNIYPFYIAVLVEMAAGVLLVYLFLKTDLLTVIIAMVSFHTLRSAYAFFNPGNIAYIESGYFLLALFVLLTIYSIITLFSKDKISEFHNITPAFVKNITERQRLQRELEIARDVQMSFLPRKNPEFKGLDIASRCLPALEVGGDYYDFVIPGNNKLGIIIGDVSGKGTQAAFYMTLTKGFLKAISKVCDSASDMLRKMNELFYENVERGTFISMIYGIFDMENKILTIARAGHNPVIARKTASGIVQKINPTGLALGLEKGSIFNRTIKETEVAFEPGDVFVFYTDGFTEAMNKAKEEYGEDKLSEAVIKYSDRSSAELMEIIYNDVQAFMGKAKQHDDMTMVVVKIGS